MNDKFIKKVAVTKSCIGCPHFCDFDDPPGYCKELDVDIDIHDKDGEQRQDYIYEGCKLEDYPDYNHQFDKWLEKHFPHIKKEWDILRVKDDR